MTRTELIETIQQKQSFLCVGLDTDIHKLPAILKNHPKAVVEFNKAIIESTQPYCVAYKINTAFYEAAGAEGWKWMEETLHYIPSTHFKIADAKRGDIGHTAIQYAKAFFETLSFDAITLSPYMGSDSLEPFLNYKNKFAIVLALTSNHGAEDFELLPTKNGLLYETVLKKITALGTPDNLMFVAGATRPETFLTIRNIVPEHFLLIPGIGAQGGDLDTVCKYALQDNVNILINVSRHILYASSTKYFAEAAREAAIHIQQQMKRFIPGL